MTLLLPGAQIIHPDVLELLARLGHKGRILVTDALFSTATNTSPRSRVVHLALTPGMPSVGDVTTALERAIPIEEICRMRPESGRMDLPVHLELDALLPTSRVAHSWLPRQKFYDLARSDEVGLVIATGDIRRFANVLLTVGSLDLERGTMEDQ